MISDATMHEIVGILSTEADVLTVAAHLAAEAHNAPYAQAKLIRADRLRAIVSEIHDHLRHAPAAPGDDAINA